MSMSNQEAIEIIELARAQIEWDYPMDYAVAFDMAISAIKAQDLQQKLQPTCNQLATDTISRQAAIDAVKELTKWYYETFHETRPTADAVIDKLMMLPSAQPDIIACVNCKNWIRHDRRCGFWNHGVKPLNWCCYAERREE